MKRLAILVSPILLASLCNVVAAEKEHPYLIWTKNDIAEIKKRIETQPWARKAAEELSASTDRQGDEIRNLFKYAVLGDKAAGEIERRNLARWVKAPDPLGASIEYRVLAYDVLYHDLTEEERAATEARLRRYIEYANQPGMAYNAKLFNNAANYARYDGEEGKYTRANWLPNIIWPWKISSNLAALAIGDEKLIRQTWATPASMKWYFDEYLADQGFYMEEFGKMTSTPGAMLIYCIGARNLGLDDLGFGFKGKGGATMRGHIASIIDITYPKLDIGTARPMYPQLTIGDLRPYPPFQYNTVDGFFGNSKERNTLWESRGAWGGTTRGNSQQWDNDKTEKMNIRQWFEIAHRFYPKEGFDYFLGQMREPDQEMYYPQLFWNIDAIDPAKANAPARASAVWPGRGLAILRHDESPATWESKSPTAALRFTNEYAHHVNDSLALVGLMAFNRMIYVNPKTDPSYAFGFSRSVRSHCSVMIDGHVKVDDWGKTGSIEPKFTNDCTVRHAFTPDVKFVAARTKERYPGVDETRALFLTSDYMLDVFSSAGTKEHNFTWLMHTYGVAQIDKDWKASKDLADLIPQLGDEHSLNTNGKDFSIVVRQVKRPDEMPDNPLPESWFEKKIGVRMHMLGESGTTAYITRTPHPRSGSADKPAPRPIVDGVTMVATRKASATAFVALHEPFENDTTKIEQFSRIAQTPAALAVAVKGKSGTGIDDRILLRIGDHHDQPITLGGEGDSSEHFTFTDNAFIRITADTVTVHGDVRAIKLRVGSLRPKLLVNGKNANARTEGDFLISEIQAPK